MAKRVARSASKKGGTAKKKALSKSSSMRIVRVMARQIIDSRGNPTVEAEMIWREAQRAGRSALGRIHRGARSARTARRR